MTKQQYYGGKLPKSLGMHYVEDVVDYALRQELDKLKTQVTRIQSKVDKLEYKVNKKDV